MNNVRLRFNTINDLFCMQQILIDLCTYLETESLMELMDVQYPCTSYLSIPVLPNFREFLFLFRSVAGPTTKNTTPTRVGSHDDCRFMFIIENKTKTTMRVTLM